MSTELINPDIDRVDAVSGPATGIPFLMFKNADGGPVAKASDDAEDVAEEVAEADGPNIDGTPVADADIVEASPGDPAWEAVDAAKARVAVAGLAALQSLVEELSQREAAEGTEDRWDLCDAGEALEFALGVLARFSVTEQLEADDAAEAVDVAKSRAEQVLKALHLEVHEGTPAKPEPGAVDPVAPVVDAMAPEVPEAPVAPAEPVPPVAKAGEPLPSGLQEILDTFVESYSAYKEAQDTGAESGVEASDFTEAAPAEAPVADAITPEAPVTPEAPTVPAAPEPAPPVAPHEPPAAPAEEDPAEKLKKSMQDAITEAVKAATAPLLKQIDVLERTPVDSGPMLAGQQPGTAGQPLVRGQEEGAVAKGLTSATAQAAPGTNALADGIKALYRR